MLDSLAAISRVTCERIRQIEKRALRTLKRKSAGVDAMPSKMNNCCSHL
jgi:DNA-directed RNA polymerase sigma subunit (sigma70/sigma32)